MMINAIAEAQGRLSDTQLKPVKFELDHWEQNRPRLLTGTKKPPPG
jgi:hypothetical protein